MDNLGVSRARSRSPSPLLYRPSLSERYRPLTPSEKLDLDLRVERAVRRSKSRERLAQLELEEVSLLPVILIYWPISLLCIITWYKHLINMSLSVWACWLGIVNCLIHLSKLNSRVESVRKAIYNIIKDGGISANDLCMFHLRNLLIYDIHFWKKVTFFIPLYLSCTIMYMTRKLRTLINKIVDANVKT